MGIKCKNCNKMIGKNDMFCSYCGTKIDNSKSEDKGDSFMLIERLADLKEKGIISDDEFSGKKAELMAKI